MVHIRVAREKGREEIPFHFEGVHLVPWARLVGWCVAVTCAAGGVTLMVAAAGRWLELVGAIAAAVGGILLAALVRCRRFESIVGKSWYRTRCGPLSNDLPLGLIKNAAAEPSTGWRRLYSSQQVTIELSMGGGRTCAPSSEPAELISSILSSSGRDRD